MLLDNLTTERLRFRPLRHEDEDLLLEFFSDPVATEFLFMEADAPAYTRNWLKRQLKRYETGSGGLFAIEIKDTGELIGQCGLLRQWVDGIPKWEVGYHLIRRFWGHGYATEAAIACRNFCFEEEMAETIISLIHPENVRSQAVAKRNGMTFWKDTTFREQPSKVFRIRREDWENGDNEN